MGKAVRITADNQVSVIDITPFEHKGWCKAIGGGCDIVEKACTQTMFDLFKMPLLMLLDEEFYAREGKPNMAASFLYSDSRPLDTVRGNALFAVPDGADILPLSEKEAEMVKGKLMREFAFLREEKQDAG